jgi:hypothetical protein
MADKDAFDQWWEWATKDRATDYRTIDAKIHNAVMKLTPEERADRATVNEAVRTQMTRYVRLGARTNLGCRSQRRMLCP